MSAVTDTKAKRQAPKMVKVRVTLPDGSRKRVMAAMPVCVGATRAAQILGVPKSNISRYREQGRMPTPVPMDGVGGPFFVKVEVEEFAEVLAAERERREKARGGEAA